MHDVYASGQEWTRDDRSGQEVTHVLHLLDELQRAGESAFFLPRASSFPLIIHHPVSTIHGQVIDASRAIPSDGRDAGLTQGPLHLGACRK